MSINWYCSLKYIALLPLTILPVKFISPFTSACWHVIVLFDVIVPFAVILPLASILPLKFTLPFTSTSFVVTMPF